MLTTFSTPLLVAAAAAFLWMVGVRLLEFSKLGASVPEAYRHGLAAAGGLLLGAALQIAQGQDWKLVLVASLITGATGMAAISNPTASSNPGAPATGSPYRDPGAAPAAQTTIDPPKTARALAGRLPAAALGVIGFALVACAGWSRVVTSLEQGLCAFVPVLAPGTTNVVGTVCQDALPFVNTVVTDVVTAAGGPPAKLRAVSTKDCKLVPISGDGKVGQGVVCGDFCGDLSTATATDPCPKVDAELRSHGAMKVTGKW